MLDPLSLYIPTEDATRTAPSGPPRKLLKPIAGTQDYTIEIDYSSYSSFLECPRKAENELIYSRQGRRSDSALNFGHLFHELEELRLAHGLTPEVVQRQRELIAKHYVDHPVAVGEYRNAATMTQVIEKYNKLYATDGWPERVHIFEGEKFVERPFKIELCTIPVEAVIPYSSSQLISENVWNTKDLPIGNLHILLTGRIDAILSDSNALWVVDHKTSSRGGKEYEEAFYLSMQTRGYCWAARKLGIPVIGLIMNAAVVRPPTKTGTGIEFQRHHYSYTSSNPDGTLNTDTLDEFEANVTAIMSDFVAHLVRGYFPQHSRSFKSPCAGCDFQDNCRLPRHQRAADLASDLYQNITWNPIDQ